MEYLVVGFSVACVIAVFLQVQCYFGYVRKEVA